MDMLSLTVEIATLQQTFAEQSNTIHQLQKGIREKDEEINRLKSHACKVCNLCVKSVVAKEGKLKHIFKYCTGITLEISSIANIFGARRNKCEVQFIKRGSEKCKI